MLPTYPLEASTLVDTCKGLSGGARGTVYCCRTQLLRLIYCQGIIRNLWLLRMQTLPSVESLSQESSQEQYSSITSKSESELEAPQRAKARKLPHIVESLCLCYLSLVLLQLPISFGELNRWLSEDGFTFVTAFEKLPDIMTRNLAAEYCAALQARVRLSRLEEEDTTVGLTTPRSPFQNLVDCSASRQN